MMRNCWAALAGGCSDKITKEHTVTAALFATDEVMVQGFDWCLNEPKKVGLPNIAKRNLCSIHNSQLSDIDDAAINLARAFKQVSAPLSATNHDDPTVPTASIDGRKLERWALKTLINIGTQSKHPIGRNANKPGTPSPLLVKIVFGARSFPPRTGIYSVGDPTGRFEFSSRFQFTPFFTSKYILGTLFSFCGLGFCLMLEDPQMTIKQLRVMQNNVLIQNPPVLYHPPAIELEAAGRRANVKFNW
jgi:hypothetical protein